MDPQDNPPTNPPTNPPNQWAPGAAAPHPPAQQPPAQTPSYGPPAQQYGQPAYAPQPPQQPGQPPYPPQGQPYPPQQPPYGQQQYAAPPYGQQPPQPPFPQQPPQQQPARGKPGVHPAVANFDHSLVTTAFDLPGYTVTRNYGLVRGIIVRSRSILGSIGASFQTIAGGNISLYTELCERARTDAYETMIQHAAQIGANGIIGVRYDATEIAQGVSEVLCYGTAVTLTPARPTN